jgi:hypothetical protein
MNPYLDLIRSTLPRILSNLNSNKLHPLYGNSDRRYWSWRTIDFTNSTNQGVVDGMLKLYDANLWPYSSHKDEFIERLISVFTATRKIVRKDGSLEESFPYEKSWCVSALVSYNLAGALNNLKNLIDNDTYDLCKDTVQIIQTFVCKYPEKHAVIANHWGAASASLFRGYKLTGDAYLLNRANKFLETLLSFQNEDGAFMEYQGFDPGYQTLTMDYLADIYIEHGVKNIEKNIESSLNILDHFVLPDGSFGGNFGSRGTRIYYPGGISKLAEFFPKARVITQKMNFNISHQKTITLLAVDDGNLSPLFNSYVDSAIACSKEGKQTNITEIITEPYNFRIHYKKTGIIIDKNRNQHTYISVNKGGYFENFVENHQIIRGNLSRFVKNGNIVTAEIYNNTNVANITGDVITVESKFGIYNPKIQNAFNLSMSRLVFFMSKNSVKINQLLKKIIVKFFFKENFIKAFSHKRVIYLQEQLVHVDTFDISSSKYIKLNDNNNYFSEMASAGYWQIGDENNLEANSDS